MEDLLGVLAVIVVFAVPALWIFWLRPAMNRQLNQKVFNRKAHAEGTQLTSQVLSFTTTATKDQVKQALLDNVQVAPKRPPVLADAYFDGATDSAIRISCGNRLHHHFDGLIELRPDGTGTSGTWEIQHWTLVDGVTASVSVMKRLNADIRSAVLSVDRNATFRVMHGATT